MPIHQTIYSFDSTVRVEGHLVRPDRYRDLFRELSAGPFIPRGAGSSYTLASAGEGVKSVLSERFNRILSFDEATGILEAEAGISLGDLVYFLKSKGWWLSTLPGHPKVTLGGAIAFNIHGKSQFRHGCIGDKIIGLSVYHPESGLCEITRDHPNELMGLTIGGMGLTGFIVSATIQCEKLQGNGIRRQRIPVADLQEAAEVIEEYKNQCDQIYSWNNFNVTGKKFGRGFVFLETYISRNIQKFRGFYNLNAAPRSRGWTSYISPLVRNQLGRVYEYSEKLKPVSVDLEILQGAFPFNGKEIYHRLFGGNGLLESQFIVPPDRWNAVTTALKRLFEAHRLQTTLGSLKLFGGQQKYLYFQGEGFCLSFDMPYTNEAAKFFAEIDKVVVENGCLPSIAKDSRLPADVIKKTYQEYELFRNLLHNYDPKLTIQSELRQRLAL